MTKKIWQYVLTCMMMLLSLNASSQVTVEQNVDSVGILIGEQAHLQLTVTMPAGSTIQWPALKERQLVVPGVEVVKVADADTLSMSGKELKVRKVYTITSFDEHLYSIPPLSVKVNGKTYQGGVAALKVITMNVDTLHPNQFFPPKDVQDNPFSWAEWSPYFWLSLLLLLIVLVMGYLFIRLHSNKPVITRIRIVKHVPAHQRALNAISKIKEEHLTTSEDQKTYYTQLTDTLRKYIQERFGFNALEMTSSEIIEKLNETGDKKMIDELHELFTTADLVKFAKYSTLINENDLNLVNAINFIDETKQENQPTEERIVPQLSEGDKRTRQNRITIKSLLWALGIIAAACLVYVCYHVWLLLG